jgi:HlyD family secretion protein
MRGAGASSPGAGGGFAAAAEQLGASTDVGLSGRGTQTVYLSLGGDRVKAISIRTGITDGRYTQVLEGPLKPGDKVVIGQATSKVDNTTRPPGGRMF